MRPHDSTVNVKLDIDAGDLASALAKALRDLADRLEAAATEGDEQ